MRFPGALRRRANSLVQVRGQLSEIRGLERADPFGPGSGRAASSRDGCAARNHRPLRRRARALPRAAISPRPASSGMGWRQSTNPRPARHRSLATTPTTSWHRRRPHHGMAFSCLRASDESSDRDEGVHLRPDESGDLIRHRCTGAAHRARQNIDTADVTDQNFTGDG